MGGIESRLYPKFNQNRINCFVDSNSNAHTATDGVKKNITVECVLQQMIYNIHLTLQNKVL